MRPVAVPAGATVFDQGEPGESFYVIDEGEVEALVDGERRRVERSGEFFGEIALPHERRAPPRSGRSRPPACSRSTCDELINSDHRDHPRSIRSADAVITYRLEGCHRRPAPSGSPQPIDGR